MAGNYYGLARTKQLLNIDTDDSAEDELLNTFGEAANHHIDNILKMHDEKIPLKEPGIEADIKSAANYLVAAKYRGKRGDKDTAEFWMNLFKDTINGIISEDSIEGFSYISERFRGRAGIEDIWRLWI